jgi:hypothetical protein
LWGGFCPGYLIALSDGGGAVECSVVTLKARSEGKTGQLQERVMSPLDLRLNGKVQQRAGR